VLLTLLAKRRNCLLIDFFAMMELELELDRTAAPHRRSYEQLVQGFAHESTRTRCRGRALPSGGNWPSTTGLSTSPYRSNNRLVSMGLVVARRGPVTGGAARHAHARAAATEDWHRRASRDVLLSDVFADRRADQGGRRWLPNEWSTRPACSMRCVR